MARARGLGRIAAMALASLAVVALARAAQPLPRTRITLEVQRADVHDVLRLLCDDAGINLVLDDRVQGQVTLQLRQVRWDQALAVVLQSKGLGSVWDGAILRVAPQAVLQAEREQAARGEDLWWQTAPLKTWILPVNHARAEELLPHVQATLSPRGNASVDQRTNVIIVHDVDPRDRP